MSLCGAEWELASLMSRLNDGGCRTSVDADWTPEQAHLQGVHEVLNQEEAAHLLQGSVDVGQTVVHVLAEGLRGDADILIYQCSAEREKEGEGEHKMRLSVRAQSAADKNILIQPVVKQL